MYKVRNNPPLRRSRKKVIILAAASVVALAAIITALELTDKTYFFHDRYPNYETAPNNDKRSGGSNTKGESANDDNKQPAPAEQPVDNKDNGTAAPSATLVTPSGTFVSNHRPNLSGTPRPNEIQSTCVTTPGASCTIVFRKGSVTKQLPAQTTDKEGAAYWTWKLQDIGITEGNWDVEAKATLNGQSKTAQDPTPLEVSP